MIADELHPGFKFLLQSVEFCLAHSGLLLLAHGWTHVLTLPGEDDD